MTTLTVSSGSLVVSGFPETTFVSITSANTGQITLTRSSQRIVVTAFDQMQSTDSVKFPASSEVGDDIIIVHKNPYAIYPQSGEKILPFITSAGYGVKITGSDTGLTVWVIKINSTDWVMISVEKVASFSTIAP